jgi:sugar phosphate isomerase/epimerase
MYTLLVQMADEQWTMSALHLACALARSVDGKVVLLRLMQVRHPSYLGTEFGDKSPDEREYQNLKEYAATAEDYGLQLVVQPMQCATSLDAVVDAAEQLDAFVVFAHVPETRFAYWRRFQIWNMERRLHSQHRQLFMLDRPVADIRWMPSITFNAPAPS